MKKALPFLVVLILLLGFFIGQNFTKKESGITTIIFNNDNKLSQIFDIIGSEYVDKADIDSIIERSIPKVLEELDPHSTYIPKDEVEEMTSDLQSSFSGIGIRFTIQAFHQRRKVKLLLHFIDFQNGNTADKTARMCRFFIF